MVTLATKDHTTETSGADLLSDLTSDMEAIETAINTIDDRVDLGAEGSDYSLAVGEEGFVDFAAATDVALNVAVGEGQMYELILLLSSPAVVCSSISVLLYANNAADASAFTYNRDYLGSSDGSGSSDGFLLGIGTVSMAKTLIGISAARVSMGWATGTVGGTFFPIDIGSTWTDLVTAWTSLGTLHFGAVASGKAIVRRIS